MRRKIIEIVEILGQATSMIVKIALSGNKIENNDQDNIENNIENNIEYKPITEDESNALINSFLGALEKTNKFFGEWDEREDDDKHDEFLHLFYNLEHLIKKMESHGIIVQTKNSDGTTEIEIPKLESGRNDN